MGLDGDGLINLYNETIGALLDRQVPLRTKTCRCRPSNPWFDDECPTAKRSLRSLERTARRSGPLADTTSSAVQAWLAERSRYLSLIHQKRLSFWTSRIEADGQNPRRLWRSFEQLLGHGRDPSADVDAAVLHRFFDDKVAGVHTAMANAAAPQFTPAPVG